MQKVIEAHVVEISEYERGWGSRLDEIQYFKTLKEARDFCDKFNNRNTEENAPDWYMVAEYVGKKRFPQFN